MRRLKFIDEPPHVRGPLLCSPAFSHHRAARTTCAFSTSRFRPHASPVSISSFLARLTKRRFCMGKVRGARSRRSFLVHAVPHRGAVSVHEIVQRNRRRLATTVLLERCASTKRSCTAALHSLRAASFNECHQDCVGDFTADPGSRCRYAQRHSETPIRLNSAGARDRCEFGRQGAMRRVCTPEQGPWPLNRGPQPRVSCCACDWHM